MNILFLSTRTARTAHQRPQPSHLPHPEGRGAGTRRDLVTFAQHPEHAVIAENLDICELLQGGPPFPISRRLSRVTLFRTLLRNLFSRLPFVAHKYDSR